MRKMALHLQGSTSSPWEILQSLGKEGKEGAKRSMYGHTACGKTVSSKEGAEQVYTQVKEGYLSSCL